MNQDSLRIEQLVLKNFRCFEECSINLHRQLTVLVANNGGGKTALLDAIAVALGLFVDTVAGNHAHPGFEVTDVRLSSVPGAGMVPQLPVRLEAAGVADGRRIQWARARKGASARNKTTIREAKELVNVAQGVRDRLDGFAQGARGLPPPLPVVAFYGTGRLWSALRLTERRRAIDPSVPGRTAGYLDCLSPSSSFRTFADWYKQTAQAVRGSVVTGLADQWRPESLLAAVRKAVNIMLEPTPWSTIDWDFGAGLMVVEDRQGQRLPLSLLSDGVRNTIALTADLAHRCVRLNPHFGEQAAERTPGVLLIDEVDMHLHPGWQQHVVELLRKAFPLMQMVVSTHSPQLISTVDHTSVRIIDPNGVVRTPRLQTRGVESADVLARVMEVDPVPPVPQAEWLSAYRALTQTGRDQSPEAVGLWQRLCDHFGEHHPVMDELATLRTLQEIKRARLVRQEGT